MARQRESSILSWVMVVSVLVLTGCGTGRLDSVAQHLGPPDYPPDRRDALRFQLDRPGGVVMVRGKGTCGRLRVNFGDLQSVDVDNQDLSSGVLVGHTYSGWGGAKKVVAEGVSNCTGRAETQVMVLSDRVAVGIWPTTTACVPIPGKPEIRPGTVISAIPQATPETKIDFGCLFGGCVWGIDGAPDPAPNGYPFPGLRKYSLVYRVGTQVGQGGNGVPFTATQSGPLELCLNDDLLRDNGGAWGIWLMVNEAGAN